MKQITTVFAAIVMSFFLYGNCLAEGTVSLHGATTLEKIIKAKQADIEAKAGVKIEVVGNGTGRGLEELAGGKTDIAMIGGPLSVNAAVINEKTPDLIKPAELKEELLFTMPAVVIVNPANTGVEMLKADQLKGLLTGAIKNWKEVGGADVPVVVVAPSPGDGVRSFIQASLLKEEKLAADTRIMQVSPDVPKVVSQIPGGVAVVSSKHADSSVKTIKTDASMDVPFSLVTKIGPKDPIPAVINAVKELAKP